jgi:DNA-binding HxlR family transcriptional regulator
VKQYNQFCSVARALDVIGDRWALLVVRELLLGPRRFTDLADGLPGIGTNVLATRLRELEAHGIIARRQLLPPTPAALYELTEDGEALRSVLHEVSRWGMRRLAPRQPEDVVRAEWFVLALAGSLDAGMLTAGQSFALLIDGKPFTLSVTTDRVAPTAGAPSTSEATIIATLPALFELASGADSLAALSKNGAITVTGDRSAARRLLEAAERLRWAQPKAVPRPRRAEHRL